MKYVLKGEKINKILDWADSQEKGENFWDNMVEEIINLPDRPEELSAEESGLTQMPDTVSEIVEKMEKNVITPREAAEQLFEEHTGDFAISKESDVVKAMERAGKRETGTSRVEPGPGLEPTEEQIGTTLPEAAEP